MIQRRSALIIAIAVAVASCSGARAASPPAPSPVSGPATPGPARRVPPSRDSLAKLRSVYVAQVMRQIAGREDQPAEQVFKNVQVLKGITAAELVKKMDKDYATAMSWNCTNCHRLAPRGDFASDTSNDKRRARFMQQMQNDINRNQLPKLYPKDTPSVTCATCHRGYNEPPSAEYLLPERGKPGGLPVLAPTGARPGGPPGNGQP